MFNFTQRVEATPELRRAAERDSIRSAACGAMGDVTLTDSAVIILYASMLGASDMFSMITTALGPLCNGLLLIPMAYIATRVGNQGIIARASVFSLFAYAMIAAAPFFPSIQVEILIGMMIVFSISHTGYLAGWFPMLDSFLTPERRGGYLGRMRFSWQLSSALFIFLISRFIGASPSIQRLQAVMLLGALVYAGRPLFIARIPVFAESGPKRFGFRDGLATALANKPLAGFSVYLFVINLAAYGTIPLAILYLKRQLLASDDVVVLLSSVSLGGMLLGSLAAGRIIQRVGIKRALLGIHCVYGLTNVLLFLIGPDTLPAPWIYVAVGALLFIYSFTFANANIASTSEMMALTTPGNKTMAMAFCGTFSSTGQGLSRLLSSLVLGSGLLATEWSVGGKVFCHYQTLFLAYSAAVLFAAMLLVVVPAIFPRGEYAYEAH